MSGVSRILSLRSSGVRGGYSPGVVPVGEEAADDDVEVWPLDMEEDEDVPLEAAWAFDTRSRIAWMDWTTLRWMTARHEVLSARNA